MSEHTPELLYLERWPDVIELRTHGQVISGVVATVWTGWAKDHQQAEQRANAERLMACWNALAGMNPDGVKLAVEALEDIESKIVDFEAGRINWRPDDFLQRVRAALSSIRKQEVGK